MDKSFIRGMDISTLLELEKSGAAYYENGQQKELLDILKNNGVNLIRLRIWNDPYDESGCVYGGGGNDFNSVLKIAEKIRNKEMMFLLDFHYSDFWTDPKKQVKPKKWKELSGDALKAALYHYTEQILSDLKKNDLIPDMVQIGNEITNGLLWPDGQLPTYRNREKEQPHRDYQAMFSLLEQGIRAVRSAAGQAKIILHLDYGGDNGLYREWFDAATDNEIDYDMIGLSYYPYWHGTLEDLEANLQDISRRYQKDVLVVETSYGFTLEDREGCSLLFTKELAAQTKYAPTPQGQKEFIEELIQCIRRVKDRRGKGFVYWEPAWIPAGYSTWATPEGQKYMGDTAPQGNTWANQALFDYNGNALPALAAIRDS